MTDAKSARLPGANRNGSPLVFISPNMFQKEVRDRDHRRGLS
jgi:hypothetical protein